MLGNTRRARWTATLALVLCAWALPAVAASGRPWLGVVTQAVDDDLRRGLDLDADGALVNQILRDSPAERAGIRAGDVILRFDGRRVASPGTLTELVQDSEIGRTVRVDVNRRGERRTFDVRVGERPDDMDFDRREAPAPPDAPDAPDAPEAPEPPVRVRDGSRYRIEVEKQGDRDGEPEVRIHGFRDGRPMSEDELDELRREFGRKGGLGLEGLKELKGLEGIRDMPHMMMLGTGRGRLGVRIESVDDDLASALGLSRSGGAFVTEVLDDTPAARAGLRKGDVITAVDGREVRDAGALRDVLADKEGTVSLTVVRRGARRTLSATIEPRPAPRRLEWRGSGPGGKEGGKNWSWERSRLAPEADRDGAARDNELKELREELRELRRQLEEMKNR